MAAQSAPATLTLSHTQLTMFAECPHKWHLLYRQRTPRVPSGYLILGDALHKAIASYLRALRDGLATPDAEDLTNDAFTAFYTRQASEDPEGIYLDVQTGALLEKRLVAATRAFHAYMERQRVEASRVALPLVVRQVEAPFAVTHPRDASILLRGTLDLVTEPQAGHYVGIDWKSGRTFDEKAAASSMQAEAYLLGAGRMAAASGEQGEWHPLRRFSFVAFPYDPQRDTCGVRVLPAPRDGKRLARFIAHVEEVAGEIRRHEERGTYAAHTSAACARCDVLHACMAGQDWLKSRRIAPRVSLVAPVAPVVASPSPSSGESDSDSDDTD